MALTTIPLADHLSEALLDAVKQAIAPREEGFVRVDAPPSEDEAASRRIDLRGPLDEDPGPIALPEADGESGGRVVVLRVVPPIP